ncbi:MAG TPA: hypothetical protein VF183_01155 [Acidimicrobiales bacterium]
MTADSDDVADTANRKPIGSLTELPTAPARRALPDPQTNPPEEPNADTVVYRTGAAQAAENLANESPA